MTNGVLRREAAAHDLLHEGHESYGLTDLRSCVMMFRQTVENVTRAERVDANFLIYQKRKHRYTDGACRDLDRRHFALVADMIFYFTHLFGHRTQIGWAFHKVHHSAAVLTPLTRYREHFVEGILYGAGAAAGLGLCGGVFAYIFRGPITQITVMNLGLFVFLFAINGNFRHYHVSFRYPPWLERWLQSPGMHHVHHSYLPHHRDKNLGLVTSVWDRLVGTLYIGSPYEETPWGLGLDEQAHYSTFVQNVFGPFRDVYRLIVPPR